MYTNVVQHCNCQSQDNFSTLNITLTFRKCSRHICNLPSADCNTSPVCWGQIIHDQESSHTLPIKEDTLPVCRKCNSVIATLFTLIEQSQETNLQASSCRLMYITKRITFDQDSDHTLPIRVDTLPACQKRNLVNGDSNAFHTYWAFTRDKFATFQLQGATHY